MTTELLYREGDTLWEMAVRRAQATGDATAFADEYGRTVTFAGMVEAAERVAAGLLERGLAPGSTVSWQLATRIDTIVLALALSRLSVTQNPIIPIYRRREVGAMIRQCDAGWLIVPETFRGFEHAAMAQELRAESAAALQVLVLTAELPEGDPATLPPAPSGSADEVRWIYTTSGTTSAPKGVCHTDGTLIAGGLGLVDSHGTGPSDTGTIISPFAHIAGPDMLVAALATGMRVAIMEVFAPVRAVEHLSEQGVTIYGGSTAHYSLLLAEQRKQPDTPVIPSLRIMAGGGAPLPEMLFHEAGTEIGVPILHGYGMTECPMITSARPDDTVAQLAKTSGRPVLGAEVQIRSENDEVLPTGVNGRIWVRGPMLFRHYLADGEIVRPFDENGWFFTGDIGHLADSGHITLVGREKDLIIRKGESISPVEIEDVVADHPAVGGVAVIGLPDDTRGERICAVIELNAEQAAPSLADIREHCLAAGLSPTKFPEQIEFVAAMPRTPTMKIRKQQLRTEIIDRGESEPTAAAPAVAR